jgi:5'-nucleotidase
MLILLTNDDGIQAAGLRALYNELRKIARVTVVAPDSQRSSVGHGITLSHPIWQARYPLNKKGEGIGISGTPADCVKFGISVVLKKKPDLVVSGINLGPNDGCSVFYSGTVAGAREGALYGIPSMAVSLDTFTDPRYDYAARVAGRLAKKLAAASSIPKGTFLSVNVPNKPERQIKGIRVTRQGLAPILGSFVKRRDPNLRDYYWMTGRLPKSRKNLTCDTDALLQGYVTVTPVSCDLTDDRTLTALKDWNLDAG